MTVTRYNPFNVDDFTGLMNQIFADAPARAWTPAIDIFESENDVVLKADLPGVKQEDIDIRLENGTLTLKGERKFEKPDEGKGYHRLERGYGAFTRVFTLPESLDDASVKADYRNGVLSITIGKKEVAKPRSIKVQVGGE